MSTVEIYTWQYCPFCIRAKNLLNQKGVAYKEYSIDGDEKARTSMMERSNGRKTVPQIFINDLGIGGCDELYALEQADQLNAMLGLTS